jgi:phage terminase small subunit
MTRAQRNFVHYYIESDFRNATAAYQKAYPESSEESARRDASRLLTKADIQEYMAAAIEEILQKDKIPLEKRILDFWVKRAFYTITDIVDVNGTMLLTREQLQEKGLDVCIDSINEKTDAQGHSTVTYKFADRDEAVKMLQQYIQMIKPQTQKIEIGGLSDEARARLAKLYEDETPQRIQPEHIDPQTETPDYE